MNTSNLIVGTEDSAYAFRPNANSPFVGRPPAEAMVRITLARAGVPFVRLIGPPGSGKTQLISATLAHLIDPQRVAVIIANPASGREVESLRRACGHHMPVDEASPRPSTIWKAVSKLDLADIDLILMENCDGLASPVDVGQDATVGVLSLTGGDDKAQMYRALIERASLVLINKVDVHPQLPFNDALFRKDLHEENPDAQIIDVSVLTGEGMDRWLTWIEQMRRAKKYPITVEQGYSDWFIG